MSEICCVECRETIAFVSADDFFILFEKNNQEYKCFRCGDWRHPCKGCKFFTRNLWFSDDCAIHPHYRELICIYKKEKDES